MKGKARSQNTDMKLQHPLLLLPDQQVCISPNYSQRKKKILHHMPSSVTDTPK